MIDTMRQDHLTTRRAPLFTLVFITVVLVLSSMAVMSVTAGGYGGRRGGHGKQHHGGYEGGYAGRAQAGRSYIVTRLDNGGRRYSGWSSYGGGLGNSYGLGDGYGHGRRTYIIRSVRGGGHDSHGRYGGHSSHGGYGGHSSHSGYGGGWW